MLRGVHTEGKRVAHPAPDLLVLRQGLGLLLLSSCTISISSRHMRLQDCCSTSLPRSNFLHSTQSLWKRREVP